MTDKQKMTIDGVQIEVEQGDTGLLYATSREMKGLLVAEPTLEALVPEVSKAIAGLREAKTTAADLNDAISEAHHALEEIDHYDLRSDDAKSVAEFEALVKAHEEAVANVIAIVKATASEGAA